MAPHSSTLAWKVPWTEEPGGLQSMGSRRVRHDWVTSLSLLTFMHWRRKWQPTPIFLPGESQGRRSLVGCRLWGRTESDTTERLHFRFSLSCIGERNDNPLQYSCLENPRDGGAWWAAVSGVAQSRTRLKWLSSSSRDTYFPLNYSCFLQTSCFPKYMLNCTLFYFICTVFRTESRNSRWLWPIFFSTISLWHSVSWWLGLPRWCNGKESSCQCRRHRRYSFNPWVKKIL